MAEAQAVRDTAPRLSLALGVAAYDLHPTSDAKRWLWSALEPPYTRGTGLSKHTDTMSSAAYVEGLD